MELQDEQTLIKWTLFPEEIDFLKSNARGFENLLRYAIQLCSLKLNGRFITSYEKLPITIVNYLSKQLEGVLMHSPLAEAAVNTEVRIRKQVAHFLGFKDFNKTFHDKILIWLDKNPNYIGNKKDLATNIEEFLIREKIILPSSSQLMRTVFSIYASKQKAIFDDISKTLNNKQKKFIDSLGDNKFQKSTSIFNELQKPMGEANVKNILSRIELLEQLQKLQLNKLPLETINPDYRQKLAKLVEYYDASSLRKIKPIAKRYTMVVCYLSEISKVMLDQIIDANDKLLGEIDRRINRDFEEEYKHIRNEAQLSRKLALHTLKRLLNHKQRNILTIDQFCYEIGNDKLNKIITDCEKFEEFAQAGKIALGKRRHHYLTEYMKKFLSLDFKATKGSETILKATKTFIKYHDQTILPRKVTYSFIENPWRYRLHDHTGKIDKKTWELGLFFATRKALKSSNLYLPQSRNHRDFWAPLYDKSKWDCNKLDHYEELGLPKNPKQVCQSLKIEFNEQLAQAITSFGNQQFAEVKNNRLIIHTDEALPIANSVSELQGLIDSYNEPVRIEKLLTYIQSKINYTKAFKPIIGFEPKNPLQLPILNAAITGHATNLGLYGISKNAQGISPDKLRHTSNWYLTTDNLKNANEMIINKHQEYWLTELFGDGKKSSSDGQRFVLNKKSPLGSFHPRYFGAVDRGFSVYTHVSNQLSVFSTQIISCGLREASYVLDGLLDNQSLIRPTEHSTDTHGFTEILFGLMFLLGISFQPHFRDLKDQQLYCLDRKSIAKEYRELLSQEKINVELIYEQWDDIIRLVYSLKKLYIQAYLIIQKLSNQQSSTKLAKALMHLGRLVKTIYILRYFHDKELRYAVRLQLNKGELRHSLARYIFFADQGAFKTNDYQEIMNKASCLSFVSNAIVLWNTEKMQNIYEILENKGYQLHKEDMTKISPISFKNILIHGTYHFLDE